ncbi:MAG: FecR domain-containing protein [Proteobacteria bacterium]|nr:FecR domain-containing protein [Pseudomonadota bacterium]
MKATVKTTTFILLLTAFFAVRIYAANIGSVVLLSGQVKVESADKYQLFDQPNTTIEVTEKDKIHTGEKTRAKVYLRDKKEVVHLYAESFLTVNQVDDDKSQLSLLIGKARFVVERTTSRLSNTARKFQVRTGNAFIGIRGTDFVVQTDGLSTSVLTLEGTVAMANLARPEVEVRVTKNKASKTTKTAPPSPPIEVPEEAREDVLTKDTAETWEDVEFQEVEEPKEPEPAEEEAGEPEEEAKAPEEEAEKPVEIETGEILKVVDEAKEQMDEATETVEEAVEQEAAQNKSIKFTVIEK